MRKQKIIFFYSHEQEKELGHKLCRNAKLLPFPLDQSIAHEIAHYKDVLVIIWDSTVEGKGLNKLREVRQKLPDSPLFLMKQNPSREYLMAALKYQVTNFFSLPIATEKIILAIDKILEPQEISFRMQTIKVFFSKLLLNGRSIIENTFNNQQGFDDHKVLGLAPTNFLSFLNKEPEPQATYDIEVALFGQLNISIRGKTVSNIKGKKNSIVLAYLLYYHKKSVHRDVLIDRFWSDVSTSSAKNSLNVAICSIRKDLAKVLKDQEVILFENESYCINPQLEIITDVEKFIYYWKKGRAIEAAQGLNSALGAYNKAVAIYKEEFLENHRFNDWCEAERNKLQETYLFILNRLSAHFYDQKNYYGCITICNKMLSKDECLEEVHRKLIKSYYALGLTDMAFKQFFKCKKVLQEEMNLSPSKPTIRLFERMQNGKSI